MESRQYLQTREAGEGVAAVIRLLEENKHWIEGYCKRDCVKTAVNSARCETIQKIEELIDACEERNGWKQKKIVDRAVRYFDNGVNSYFKTVVLKYAEEQLNINCWCINSLLTEVRRIFETDNPVLWLWCCEALSKMKSESEEFATKLIRNATRFAEQVRNHKGENCASWYCCPLNWACDNESKAEVCRNCQNEECSGCKHLHPFRPCEVMNL